MADGIWFMDPSSITPEPSAISLEPWHVSLWLIRGARACTGRRRAARVDAVEQQLERAVGLRAPRDFVAEEHHAPFADRCIDDRHGLIEVLLAPRPAAAARCR